MTFMKTILKILLAAFVLSLTPATYVCAQGHIETPAERQARQKREAAKKKREQEAAARKKREAEAAAQRQREEEARKKREAEERTRIFRELEANMVRVEGGTFTMGGTSKQDDDDRSITYLDTKPAHKVTLSSFSICKYEVTQELWEAVMGSNPSYIKGAKRPVEQVSWEDCQTFISKLNQLTGKNYRLPTEAEWEYAARGGNRSNGYKYAGGNNIDDVAWCYDNSSRQTHDVGTKRANELGLYDMSGSVEELCSDWYSSYSSGSQTNPKGPSSGSGRVIRGGGWRTSAKGCRVFVRCGYVPTARRNDIGLRLAQ